MEDFYAIKSSTLFILIFSVVEMRRLGWGSREMGGDGG